MEGSSIPAGEGLPDGGLEARFARLGEDASEIGATLARFESVLGQMSDDLVDLKSDLRDVRSDLADRRPRQPRELDASLAGLNASFVRLDGLVSKLPSTLHMAGFVLAVLALAGLIRLPGAP